MRAVIRTASVERGTSGKLATRLMNGALFVVSTELLAPGVPPTLALAAQFCPRSFGRAGWIRSRVFPPPSCGASQSQPRRPSTSAEARARTAHSPLSA